MNAVRLARSPRSIPEFLSTANAIDPPFLFGPSVNTLKPLRAAFDRYTRIRGCRQGGVDETIIRAWSPVEDRQGIGNRRPYSVVRCRAQPAKSRLRSWRGRR